MVESEQEMLISLLKQHSKAYVTPDGQYEFLAMPFGLKNAPSVFQRSVLKTLGSLAHSFIIVYMDDILIVSETKEEAYERLKLVLDVFVKAGFSFNISKCFCLKTTVRYLGYEIQAGEIRPNLNKIESLVALPPPKSVASLRHIFVNSFRGFLN